MSLEVFERLPEEKKALIISVGIKEFAEKTYKDASTDSITRTCGISKGILFHYFGSKKEFYFYCLDKAMKRLTAQTESVNENDDFYDIIFASMDRKMTLCMKYHDEMHMVNMASRDASAEIAGRKTEILQQYRMQVQYESAETLKKAVGTLKLKPNEQMVKVVEGVSVYINAVLNKYLMEYQQTPDAFFENRERIKAEMKLYLDFMLYGICREG